MTLRHIPLTMEDWENRLNGFIQMFEYGLSKDAGKVSAEIARLHAETEFEEYRVIQDRLFMSDFDRYLLELEEQASKDKSRDNGAPPSSPLTVLYSSGSRGSEPFPRTAAF